MKIKFILLISLLINQTFLFSYNNTYEDSSISKSDKISVHKRDDRWFFIIPYHLLGRDILAITRFARIAPLSPFYAGEESGKMVVKFEQGTEGKLFMRAVNYSSITDFVNDKISKSVDVISEMPIIETFDIVQNEIDKDSGSDNYQIDVTRFFESDRQLFIEPRTRAQLGLGGLAGDKSYIKEIKSFNNNIQINTVKTYTSTPSTTVVLARNVGNLTLEFSTSFLILPEIPLRTRKADERVGYFNTAFYKFGDDYHGISSKPVIIRWRLEPKSEDDYKKQTKGELIEPAKPITFYIDPATPDKWKPYFKRGVEDWNEAFEEAGWKNAIRAILWEDVDYDAELEDARYSMIRYLASSVQNASGLTNIDPRSGEIVEAQISWHHNMMEVLNDWYVIQTAAADKRARHRKLSDSLMGQLIRIVISHEVGHAIGLTHNMGASSVVPVEKLRDKAWLEQYGHSASIMDYTRFNYVAQPGDGVEDFLPRINDYDKWAVKYGYSYFPESIDEDEENSILNSWVVEAYKNPRLRFGKDGSRDARDQMEDLGDNAMKASEYGIENLKRILPNLVKWTYKEGVDYTHLKRLNSMVIEQLNNYFSHIIENIGNVYENIKTYDMDGPVYSHIPREHQKEAVNALCKHIAELPLWLAKDSISENYSSSGSVNLISTIQGRALISLLDDARLRRMTEPKLNGGYSVNELISDINASFLKDLLDNRESEPYMRSLHRIYISILTDKIKEGDQQSIPKKNYSVRIIDTDINSVIVFHLHEIHKITKRALKRAKDFETKAHYAELIRKIETVI